MEEESCEHKVFFTLNGKKIGEFKPTGVAMVPFIQLERKVSQCWQLVLAHKVVGVMRHIVHWRSSSLRYHVDGLSTVAVCGLLCTMCMVSRCV